MFGNEEEDQLPPAVTVDDFNTRVDNTEGVNAGSGKDEHYHEFTRKEIERNRIITVDWNGSEKVSTDEEVMKTLGYVHRDNSTFLHNEPHFTEGNEKRDIIGADNRFHRYYTQGYAPYSAIGYLSSPGGRCTAYLVGPRHLVTAAHCLHPSGNTRGIYSASRITFYLRRNCVTTGSLYRVSQVLVYSEYKNNGDNDYDIACLLLTSTVSSWMGFAYRDPMPTVSGEICGYPHDQGECFYCARCSDVERAGWWIFRSNTRLEYTCDTEGGMSGSPVITDDHDSTSNLYSYGVHTHGYRTRNEGVRITRNYFYDICRWMCNTGATCSAVC